MDFKEKYTDDKDDISNKKIITTEAFLIAELLSDAINEIKHMRFNNG
jgi:hypothetical protein